MDFREIYNILRGTIGDYNRMSVLLDEGWKIRVFKRIGSYDYIEQEYSCMDPEAFCGCIIRDARWSRRSVEINIKCYRKDGNCVDITAYARKGYSSVYIKLLEEFFYRNIEAKGICRDGKITIHLYRLTLGEGEHYSMEKHVECGNIGECVNLCVNFMYDKVGKYVAVYYDMLEEVRKAFLNGDVLKHIINRTLAMAGLYRLYP